jgi:imidazolonepropionase-like amidohydrolase
VLLALLGLVLAADTTLLTPSGILDEDAGRIRPGVAVLVVGQRIERVGPRGDFRPTAGWRVVDLPGLVLLPGLIDAHTHLALRGTDKATAAATLMQQAGVLTVQDLGGLPIAAAPSLPLRAVSAGAWLGRPGGTCDFSGTPMPRGANAFADAGRRLVSAGAQVLKVCISSWWADVPAHPDSLEISREELDSVVFVAHRAGVRVAAHAVSPAAVRLALAARVDALAHLPLVDLPLAREIAQAGMTVYPTAGSLLAAANGTPWRDRVDSAASALRTAGVLIVFGTDAGAVPYGRPDLEARAMRILGWGATDILRSATRDAARHLGLADATGRIASGFPADLAGYAATTLEELAALAKPQFVMSRGAIVVPH